ncbi:MAG: GNAT family N-acetyltransferase [Planctomycetota bacterium]|nr:GNAT family N-acetyltransferase [Planctomycetota bacterium]
MTLIHESHVDVRVAEASDAQGMIAVKHAAVFSIGCENYPPEQLASWSGHLDQAHIERLEDRVARRSTAFYVATIGPTIMGYGMLDLDSGEVGGPYVRPDHGREGLGTRLLEALVEQAREASLAMIFAESPANVTSFFIHRGFTPGGPSTKTLLDGTQLETVRVEQAASRFPRGCE